MLRTLEGTISRRNILRTSATLGVSLDLGTTLGCRVAMGYGTGRVETPARFAGSEDFMVRFNADPARVAELIPAPLRSSTRGGSLSIVRQKQVTLVEREHLEAVMWFRAQFPGLSLKEPYPDGYLLSHY